MKQVVRSNVLAGTALAMTLGINSVVLAGEVIDLPVQDQMVTTIIDKSIISGAIRTNDSNAMIVEDGMLSFDYDGDVYSVDTNEKTGQLEKLKEKIGTIEGTAAFPTFFVELSAGMRAIMDLLVMVDENGNPIYDLPTAMGKVGITEMPSMIEWTCNSCEMKIGDDTYVSIVDVLNPSTNNELYLYMQGQMDMKLAGSLVENTDALRLKGRAFTAVTPASFNPVDKTMSIRMAGCSAVVAVGKDGPNFGKMGTLCLNSTVTFDVSELNPANPFGADSVITAEGTSNCVTVLHTPTM